MRGPEKPAPGVGKSSRLELKSATGPGKSPKFESKFASEHGKSAKFESNSAIERGKWRENRYLSVRRACKTRVQRAE